MYRCVLLVVLYVAATIVTVHAQRVGGYAKVAVTDKDVIAAADFAVKVQSKKEMLMLAKIIKAEAQVVAGRNFRVTMDLHVDGGVRTAEATVWAKLDGTRELTRWEWKGPARK